MRTLSSFFLDSWGFYKKFWMLSKTFSFFGETYLILFSCFWIGGFFGTFGGNSYFLGDLCSILGFILWIDPLIASFSLLFYVDFLLLKILFLEIGSEMTIFSVLSFITVGDFFLSSFALFGELFLYLWCWIIYLFFLTLSSKSKSYESKLSPYWAVSPLLSVGNSIFNFSSGSCSNRF